ncbi:MAG: HAD-IIA family hydrolase [Candidatus Nanopelagicales bacterium]
MTVGDHDVLLFDLDGVVYVGQHAVPGAIEAITSATAQGARCIYVTNNASRTPEQVALHLRELGVPAQAEDVVTSSMAGATLVAQFIDEGEVLAIGGEGVAAALADRGFTPVTSFTSSVRAVMQGYGPKVGWADLAEATFAVRAGVPWVATNLDSTFPSARGIAPGNGALVEVVAQTAGRRPDAVAGKPEPALVLEAIRRTGAQRPLMIGDRLDTDIAAGSRLNLPTLLVCTGVSTREEGLAAVGEERPTYIAADLACLLPNQAWFAVA